MTTPDAPAARSRAGLANSFIRACDWLLDPRRRLSIATLTGLILVLSILRRVVRYAIGFPFWGDESFVAVNFYVRDFAGMREPLLFGQIVPLGFMWANLALAQLLGLSEWALRLLPTVCGLAGLLLFWRLCASTISRTAGLLALTFLGPAYYVVRHAVELKAYAGDLMFSVLALWLAWRVLGDDRRWVSWFGLLLLALVGVWCSYPFVFVAGGIGLTLVVQGMRDWRRSWRPLALGGTFGVLLCVSFVLMYVSYAKPHSAAASELGATALWLQAWPPLDRVWMIPVWFMGIHTGYLSAFPHGGQAPTSGITFALFCIGAVYVARRRPMLALLLLAPFALNLVAAAAKAYPYGGVQRIAQHLAPVVCLFAGQGLFVALRWLVRRHDYMRLAAGTFVVSVSAFAVGGLVTDMALPYATEESYNSYRAIREVAKDSEPQDQWVVFNAVERSAPEWAPTFYDWRGMGAVFVFDVLRFAPPGPADDGALWSPSPGTLGFPEGSGDVWLLVYWAEHNEKLTEFPQAQLDAYLAAARDALGPPDEIREHRVKGPGRKNEIIYVYRYARESGS